MKKILTSIAMVLLLAGCAKQYDDSALQTRIADLERRVTSLESSVDALRSAIGEGVFVVKVQEYVDPDTGKTIGVTVNYNNGDVKYFEITPKVDYSGPVVSIITNGAGELVWAVDGQAVQVGGKDVTVYQTPVFTIDEDGYLWVEINGEKVKLGQVQNEGATLVDGIFTDIKVEQDKIVLTLSDDTVVNIPFATAFKLSIETDDVVYEKRGEAIEVPYQVSGKTEKTVVDVTGYDPNYFDVEVTAEKIIITPLTAESAAVMSVIADSKVGLVSVAKLCVNFETATVIDPETGWVDYVISSDGGSIVANMISNVEIEAVPDDETDWITIVETKAMNAHTITMTVAANTETDSRMGYINVFKKGTEKHLETLYIYQEAFVEGPKDLSKDGAANCYIIPATVDGGSQFKFKTVKGNSTESVGTVAKAEVFWETWGTADEPTKGSVVAAASYADGYVTITMPETPHTGNAVVAVRDASDVILWSWHIWVPADEVGTLDGAVVGGKILDRNLGALIAPEAWASADAVKVEAFGLYYQWGRKDPFPGPKDLTNGPSKTPLVGEQFTKEERKVGEAELVTVEWAIQHPNYYPFSSKWNEEKSRWDKGSCDWLKESQDDLWDNEGNKTIYDPCPAGYKVPAYNTSLSFWKKSVTDWTFNKDNFYFKAPGSDIAFPLSGYIDDGGGSIVLQGRVFYWSSKTYSDHIRANGADIRTDKSGSDVYYAEKTYKARGACVRCVAE